MKVHLTSRGIQLTPDERRQLAGRMRLALGRFSGRIRRLSIRLDDLPSEAQGAAHKACHLRVEAGLDEPVTIREHQPSLPAAVAAAADRAARVVERRLRFSSLASAPGMGALLPGRAERAESAGPERS